MKGLGGAMGGNGRRVKEGIWRRLRLRLRLGLGLGLGRQAIVIGIQPQTGIEWVAPRICSITVGMQPPIHCWSSAEEMGGGEQNKTERERGREKGGGGEGNNKKRCTCKFERVGVRGMIYLQLRHDPLICLLMENK